MKNASSDLQAQKLKQACRDNAIRAYEDALIRGLCAEGAFELAMQAIMDTPVATTSSSSTRSRTGVIFIKRIYDPALPEDGLRVLVDRLWPRGIAKADASWEHWAKDLAPSTELRQWFHQHPERWTAFAKKYRAELADRHDEMRQLLAQAGGRPMTLLYAASDRDHNHARVLRSELQDLERKEQEHE